MIFIWYGNVYTYALRLINYSYCLVFFPIPRLWYTLCIPLFRQAHLWNGKKKGNGKKGWISGVSHFDYKRVKEEKLHYTGEWQKVWRTTTERHTERGGLFFLSAHLCFMSVSLKKTKKASLWTALSRAQTHTHTTPDLINNATNDQLSILFSILLGRNHSVAHRHHSAATAGSKQTGS